MIGNLSPQKKNFYPVNETNFHLHRMAPKGTQISWRKIKIRSFSETFIIRLTQALFSNSFFDKKLDQSAGLVGGHFLKS